MRTDGGGGGGGGLATARFKREITTCSNTKEIITLVPKRVYSIKKINKNSP